VISLRSRGEDLPCPPSRLIASNFATLLPFYVVVPGSTCLEKVGEVVAVKCRCGQKLKVVLYLPAYNVVAMLSMSVRL